MRGRGGEGGRVDQEGSEATGRGRWRVRRRVDRLGRSVLGESFARGGGKPWVEQGWA